MPGDLRRRLEARKFAILLVAIAAVLVVPLLIGEPGDRTSSALWGLVLLAAVNAASQNRRATLLFATVAVVVFGGRLATILAPTDRYQEPLDAGGYAVSSIFLMMTIYMVFTAVLRAPHATGDTIQGAVCVYLLIGLMWTNFYALAELAEAGSFNFPAYAPANQGSIPEHTFGYYSFVTLTTLGYGDVTPITFRARTLSWMEAVVGVTYMATVIAFLVSKMTVDRQQGREL